MEFSDRNLSCYCGHINMILFFVVVVILMKVLWIADMYSILKSCMILKLKYSDDRVSHSFMLNITIQKLT